MRLNQECILLWQSALRFWYPLIQLQFSSSASPCENCLLRPMHVRTLQPACPTRVRSVGRHVLYPVRSTLFLYARQLVFTELVNSRMVAGRDRKRPRAGHFHNEVNPIRSVFGRHSRRSILVGTLASGESMLPPNSAGYHRAGRLTLRRRAANAAKERMQRNFYRKTRIKCFECGRV